MAVPGWMSLWMFDELLQKRPSVIKPGLQRIKVALEHLPGSLEKRPVVLVGGTNGKGGTSGFLFHMMQAAGVCSGLFTSPHLIDFSERFALSERTVNDETVLGVWQDLQDHLPSAIYDELSFFEVTTLIAFRLFSESQTELDILEVGLGGRWDSTNVSDPVASVISSIGLDHQQYLGDTLLDIAREKLGIARPGKPLFLGSIDDESVLQYIQHETGRLGVPIFQYGVHFGVDGPYFYQHFDEGIFRTPLPDLVAKGPSYIQHNFCLAAAVFNWIQKPEKSIEDLSFFQKPMPACMVGRFFRQVIDFGFGPVPMIFDVCHNPQGASKLKAALHEAPGLETGAFPGIVSILGDKDVNGILDILKGFLQPLVLFRIDSDRCLSPAEIADRHKGLKIYPSFDEAVRSLELIESSRHVPWVVCGSVQAVGKVFELLSCSPKALPAKVVLATHWDDVPFRQHTGSNIS